MMLMKLLFGAGRGEIQKGCFNTTKKGQKDQIISYIDTLIDILNSHFNFDLHNGHRYPKETSSPHQISENRRKLKRIAKQISLIFATFRL